MREGTERKRTAELYEVLLFCITAVQQDLHNHLKPAYHTVSDEEGWADGVQKTGILSGPDRTPLRGVAVKLATKRSSLRGVPQQPFAPNFRSPRAALDGMPLSWHGIFKAGLASKSQRLTAIRMA